MSAQILDGLGLSRKIREELKLRVCALRNDGVEPRLDIIVASQDPASLAYVRMKQRWAAEVGITGETYEITELVRQEDVLQLVFKLNAAPEVHGVLIQHPLPSHLDEPSILQALDQRKDVDGMTPESLGMLFCDLPGFRCATPMGMMRLLDHYSIETRGKRALIIGRSIILGRPAALMMLQKDATVTIAHRHSQSLPCLCAEADILISATGQPEFIQGDWLKPGVVILDAGFSRVEGKSHDVGDCDFASCKEVASWITPVPGGVGPMTVASLLENCVQAAENLR